MNTPIENTPSDSARACERCKGTKTRFSAGFTYVCSTTGKSTVYPDRTEPCYACKGIGSFPALDVEAIVSAIKGRKGLRSARPAYALGARPYYVWRLARFHGGADVTMPVCAGMDVSGDPFRKELDVLAECVAKRVFGTDMAAAYRWSGALGHSVNVPSGLPASAYAGGPVLTGNGIKPEEEQLELR